MMRAILLLVVSGAAWAQAPVPWDTLAQVQLVPERNIFDAVMVKGRLELVKNDPGAGVFYRQHDAVPAAK